MNNIIKKKKEEEEEENSLNIEKIGKASNVWVVDKTNALPHHRYTFGNFTEEVQF